MSVERRIQRGGFVTTEHMEVTAEHMEDEESTI